MFINTHKAKQLEQALQKGSFGFEQNTELTELATLAKHIQKLPKYDLPTPHKQRLYILHLADAPVAHGIRLMRLASYVGGSTLALGLILTGIVAIQSKPGSNWYEYKNSGHELRLSFMSDQNAKANLQIRYVNDRLQDTQSVLADSNANSKVKAAALSQLTAETQATIETVRQVAIAQKDTTLLNKLQDTIDQQTAVITNTQDPAVKDATATALQATAASSKTIAEAQQLVAASNESSLAKLLPTIISGTITKVTEKDISIGKDTIALANTTEIVDAKNPGIKITLKVGTSVSVTAKEIDKVLTAQKITVTPPVPGKVKGADTDKAQKNPDQDQSIPDTVEPENTPVQSGFIIESPDPQYSKQ